MNNNNNNVDVSRKQQQQRFYRLKYSDVKNDDNSNTTKMLKTKKIMESNNNNNNNNVIEKDLLKVVVIGESGSGKSNLIQRLVNDRFEERLPSTIGIDFALYQFKLNSLFDKNRQQTYHAQIWDTAGMERLVDFFVSFFSQKNSKEFLFFFEYNRFKIAPKTCVIDKQTHTQFINTNNNQFFCLFQKK